MNTNQSESELEKNIAPFIWVKHSGIYSVCLSDVCDYKQEIFDSRANDGFIGNGYDWRSLAIIFLKEKMSEIEGKISFDCESGMFSADSMDKEVLKQFIVNFKNACENPTLIMDLFSRAELD